MEVRIVGGLLLEDDGKADDKIIAVHKDEGIWSKVRDVKELPVKVIE
jgi:inorganic pyrophosphatase